ncbi:unnamed protein product [Effrenium voratum]|nr:unnamed protein product [Effrenium voratum]
MSPGPAFGEAGEGVTVPSKDSRDDAPLTQSLPLSLPKAPLCAHRAHIAIDGNACDCLRIDSPPSRKAGLSGQRAALGVAALAQVAFASRPRRGERRATAMASTTWEGLASDARGTDAGQQLLQHWAAKAEGTVPHTDAKVRYFGKERKKPRVKIFRDQAGWCPYCQKVWLLLEEKQVDYEVEKVPMRSYGDKPKEFLALVPRGLLPAMELDGRVMTESLDIMFTIERTFPDPDKPMFPTDKALQKRASDLLNLERQLFGAWCSFLFRPEMPFIGGSEQDFTDTLQAVDAELGRSESPFFLPYPHPTIVDMQYVSHVERAVASAMFYKGYDIRKKFKNIDRWLSAYEELPHYMATKSDYYTHCMDIPPQYGPCFSNDSDLARRARELIEPKEASLPVQWQSDLEPPTELQRRSPEQDFRVEAALRLIENREAVTRFCCRGAGPDVGAWARGNPTKCQLADPYARPNLDLAPAVNAVLRVVSAALLQNDPAEVQGIKGHLAAEKLEADPKEVAKCIAYLRDRVGSPRDLSMPAAKLLRGHLAEAVRRLEALIRPRHGVLVPRALGSTRPKWRLCFRRRLLGLVAKCGKEDLAPKYQRDFFLTVIDPPCRGAFRQNPPAPFFASRAACHVADLLASRHMIAQLPGRSFEQKAVAVIGSECLAAGLVAATLGAKALFVCERSLEQYYQHNLRLFRRDTLDYTKTKSKILAVYPCSPGRTGGFDPEMLANKLQAPSLDIIVLTEVSLARVARMPCRVLEGCDSPSVEILP